MTVRRMENPVMAYAWGSRDAIATLQGRPAATDSEAELWMGAHPAAPSRLQSSDGEPAQGLDAIIAADPLGVLGKDCLERFGPRLPFLLKVLAAAALSRSGVAPGLMPKTAPTASARARSSTSCAASAPPRSSSSGTTR